MAVAACPAAEGSARGCQRDSQGTGFCRQNGGLGCPGGAQLPACHGSKFMPPFPSLPSSHLPITPPWWPPGRGPGGAPGGAGTGTQVPVTCCQHQLGERRTGRAASSPSSPSPACGRAWAQQEGKCVSKKHSHLQGESDGVLEIS